MAFGEFGTFHYNTTDGTTMFHKTSKILYFSFDIIDIYNKQVLYCILFY